MVKKAAFFALLSLVLAYGATACAEGSNVPSRKARDRADKVMESLLPGPPEVACAKSAAQAGCAPEYACHSKKSREVENAIVSVVGGVWQAATFWCPDNGSPQDKN